MKKTAVYPKLVLAMFALVLLATPVRGQTVNQDIKLLPTDGGASDQFGRPVAMDNNTIVIGARYDGDNGRRSGSAYLFDVTTGAQLHKLAPDDAAEDDLFGSSVAIHNGIVAVGARGDSDNGTASGSVYLFDASTGDQIMKIVPSDGSSNNAFGFTIAMDDGVIAIGATGDNDNGLYSGSAYLFHPVTGALLWKLLADDGAANDNFGSSIDVDSGVVIVGASMDDDNGVNSGSAYLFDVSTGDQVGKLLADDGVTDDSFGWSVAIGGGIAAVGAHHDDLDMGAAYLFDAVTGDQITRLTPADRATRGEFGISVAMHEGVLAVGMHRDDDNGDRSGSAYLFDVSTATQIAKLLPTDGATDYYFGGSIAIHGGVVTIGADSDGENGFGAGAAYIFDVNESVPAESKSLGSFKAMFR